MKLIRELYLTAWERQHACSSEQALEHVRHALQDRQHLEGLDELRAGLLFDSDNEVLEQLERGEWCLIRAEAEYGDWAVSARAFDQRVFQLMKNPPMQVSRTPRIFRLVDSITGEPMAQRRYMATVDGQVSERRTDGQGIAHLFVSQEERRISMVVIGD